MQFMRLGRLAIVGIMFGAALVACTNSGSTAASPEQHAARSFLDALAGRDASAAARATDDPGAARAAIGASLTGLGTAARGRFDLGDVTTRDKKATVAYSASWSLGPGATWTFSGSLPLAHATQGWRVVWRAADIHPNLGAGRHLELVRIQPQRAALLDRTGEPLFAPTAVVTVGLEKARITDLGSLARTLAAIPELQSTRAEIESAVNRAGPTDFVPIITLRRPVYEQLRSRIYNLAGTVFQSAIEQLPPTAQFGRQLLGRVGQPTAELLQRSKGRLAASDMTGLGGLQQRYDTTLAGAVGLAVDAVPDDSTSAATARRLAVVRKPKPGRPVRLTLDRAIQSAADAALSDVNEQAAVVVVQPSTGRVLADANSASATYDFGLSGAFPPGSTFKIATWAAAFTAQPSLTPDTDVACPATVNVDGRRFENENRFSHPPIPVSAAFGYSCNTSAITEALHLPDTALATAARALGLGRTWHLPLAAFAGSIPPPRTETERAADGIGQGRVLVSPLLMALMAGAVTDGTIVTPQLLESAPADRASSVPASLVAKMRPLMQATVQLPGGTAHALDSIGAVEGKTGTAEYGTATPPRSHSWFAGVRGDLAIAVFVYDGASTGTSAVPIAKRVLTALG